MARFFERLGLLVAAFVKDLGGHLLMFLQFLRWLFVPPFRFRILFKQMEQIGVDSFMVVVLTGSFAGMVLSFETYHALRMFSAESLVGATLSLSMTRELGPVLTGLMVAGRAGSAMAAELGTMRVTEQIDALTAMAVNPIKYLIVPRILASAIMVPLLTVMCDFLGILGGYFISVSVLHISSGVFIGKILRYTELSDLYNGLIKAFVFGLILSTVGCYKGFNASGGAEGVGRATTKTVVISCVSILIADYFLTAFMFGG